MVELVVRGWFVARCYHAAGQQRPHLGKKVCECFKNISKLIFLLIMKMFLLFFVVTSHFDMDTWPIVTRTCSLEQK